MESSTLEAASPLGVSVAMFWKGLAASTVQKLEEELRHDAALQIVTR
jgi:hypothetical protein